ncbi:MAG: MFS transporter [Alphaproteobacteria bacterium]|nr:MFS transporter [Alphaproteobacteria bacterium]
MSTAPAVPQPAALHFTYRETVTIIAGLMLGMFLSALDQTIVATALPRIAADLHGVAHLSWVVSAYLLTSTAATPIYGKLSDLYGRKIMLQIAIGIFLATSVLCGLAASMGELIFFRALQGLGGGGLIAMAHATIADVISPRERGRYQAYIAAVFAVASVIGPVLGGLFAEHLTWRWVFWINLPIGIGALAMSELTLRRLVAKRLRHRIDYLGAVLIVAAVCCILLLTTMGGNEVPWNSPVIEALAGGALVLFLACVVQELRASEPVLPPRLFANKTFAIANLVNLLTSIGMLGGIVFMPLFLQMVCGLETGQSGLMLIPLTATSVIAAITTGRLVAATGRYKIFPILGILVTGAGLTMLSLVAQSTPLWLTGAAMALSGSGIGLVMPVMMVVVQNAVESRDLGTATASISFFRSMGGSFGVALFGAVLIARLNSLIGRLAGHEALGGDPGIGLLHAGPQAQTLAPPALQPAVAAAMLQAFHELFLVGAGIALLTFIAVLFLKEVPLKTTPNDPARLDRSAPDARATSTAD